MLTPASMHLHPHMLFRQCFADVDADQSGAVDFEEFLELVHRVNEGSMCKSANNGVQRTCD